MAQNMQPESLHHGQRSEDESWPQPEDVVDHSRGQRTLRQTLTPLPTATTHSNTCHHQVVLSAKSPANRTMRQPQSIEPISIMARTKPCKISNDATPVVEIGADRNAKTEIAHDANLHPQSSSPSHHSEHHISHRYSYL